jgi:hypothetical protein
MLPAYECVLYVKFAFVCLYFIVAKVLAKKATKIANSPEFMSFPEDLWNLLNNKSLSSIISGFWAKNLLVN